MPHITSKLRPITSASSGLGEAAARRLSIKRQTCQGEHGAWLGEELEKIAKADDLHVAPFRDDGKTHGTPT